jgi:hemoglobin
MFPQHRLNVAHFVAEALGGVKLYNEREGSHFEMIDHHLSKYTLFIPIGIGTVVPY